MSLKRITSVLLATAFAASAALSGCGSSSSGQSGAPSDAGSAAPGESQQDGGAQATKSADKIIVFQSKVEIVDQLEALAEDYKAETGVEVEVWGTTGDDYFQQLKTKLANNQGPTVFSLGPGAESLQMKAYLADLSSLSFKDKIADGMADVIDGKLVGVPYTAEGFGLVYNKNAVDPTKITDTASLKAFLEEQKAAGTNGLGLSSESYFLIGHILNTPFALQADPNGFVEKLAKGEVKMAETPEFKEFAEIYAAIRDNCTNPLTVNYDKEIGDFATGKSAMIHQGNWAISMFSDYDLDFEMGLLPLPLMGNDKLAVSVPSAWYVNSQATAEEQQAGKDFIEWLYTSEKGIDYLMNQFGFIPVIDGMENTNMDVLSKDVAKYVDEGKTIPWPMNQWPAGIVDVYLVPVAEEFFTTPDMTPDQFLQKLDEAWAQASKQV